MDTTVSSDAPVIVALTQNSLIARSFVGNAEKWTGLRHIIELPSSSSNSSTTPFSGHVRLKLLFSSIAPPLYLAFPLFLVFQCLLLVELIVSCDANAVLRALILRSDDVVWLQRAQMSLNHSLWRRF